MCPILHHRDLSMLTHTNDAFLLFRDQIWTSETKEVLVDSQIWTSTKEILVDSQIWTSEIKEILVEVYRLCASPACCLENVEADARASTCLKSSKIDDF